MPRFDARFRGYGFNKRQHNIELQYMGFEFQVLPEPVFAVHRWHKSSDSKKKLSGIVKASVGRAYEEFLSDMMKRYRKSSSIGVHLQQQQSFMHFI